MLIEFIGVDGAGKTTQAKKLKTYIQTITRKKVHVVHGYKPYKYTSELNVLCEKKFKEDILSTTLCSYLYLLDAIDVFNSNIEPYLKSGDIVITDKYINSSLVYAPILGCDKKIIKQFVESFCFPDLIIFLDISPCVAYERVKNRGKELQKKESIEIMTLANEAFRRICNNKSIIINANDKPEKVHDNIIKKIKGMFDNELQL